VARVLSKVGMILQWYVLCSLPQDAKS